MFEIFVRAANLIHFLRRENVLNFMKIIILVDISPPTCYCLLLRTCQFGSAISRTADIISQTGTNFFPTYSC